MIIDTTKHNAQNIIEIAGRKIMSEKYVQRCYCMIQVTTPGQIYKKKYNTTKNHNAYSSQA